ncbi:hypothetical protein [Caenispirillum bisanense]|uniref:hypothetical protein n=1 Tax=Caenispirillum bisanense TaxID=414052 RepID=UPI0031DF8426
MIHSHQSAAPDARPTAGSEPAGAADPLDAVLRRLGEDVLTEPLPDSLLSLLLAPPPAAHGAPGA